MKILALVTYTLRELSTRITLYVLAGISTLILLGLIAGLSKNSVGVGQVLTVFGLPISPPLALFDLEQVARQVQAGLAAGLFTGVVFLGTIATAGVIPDTLERGNVEVFLSKPLARWELLLGRFLGAVGAVLLNALWFLGGVWLVFGIKLGVWNLSLLWSAFTLTLIFACAFSGIMLLGVIFRNNAIPILIGFLYLFVIGPALQGRQTSLYLISENPVYRAVLDGCYFTVPQVGAMQDAMAKHIVGAAAQWEPYLWSVLSGCALFGMGALLFSHKDF